MSPQFVDFNHDGKLDIVAGTFDGSPHVAYGTDQGFKQPEQILDHKGERIVLNQFWNFDSKKWDSTKRSDAAGNTLPNGHCTSAIAFDWDQDGDLDLLLGDHDSGHLYRRVNEGTSTEPRFALVNVPVLADGKALHVAGTVTTPLLVDWDRDGLLDLVCGGMGDAYSEATGGGVYLYRNTGKLGAPTFAAAVTLIEPSGKGHVGGPLRPDSGLYMDVADVDTDGDLDLVVGGYSHWKPKPRELTAEEKAKVAALQAELAKVNAASQATMQTVTDAVKGLDEAAAATKRGELLAAKRPELSALGKQRQSLTEELDPLVSTPQRVSYVWVYTNTTVASAPAKGQ